MATVTENKRVESIAAEMEARMQHNAKIRECYRKLQNVEAEQFGGNTYSDSAYTMRASVIAPERPAYTTVNVNAPTLEQTPQITEYVSTRSQSPVFTTEKFNAFQETAITADAPTMQQTVVEMPVQAPVQAATVAVEEQYALSRFAKIAMAGFATVVAVMFTLIGVNSRIIENKRVQLQELENRQATLTEEYAEIQRRIQVAESEDTIRQYVEENGLN